MYESQRNTEEDINKTRLSPMFEFQTTDSVYDTGSKAFIY